jgi:hypothetical protein
MHDYDTEQDLNRLFKRIIVGMALTAFALFGVGVLLVSA